MARVKIGKIKKQEEATFISLPQVNACHLQAKRLTFQACAEAGFRASQEQQALTAPSAQASWLAVRASLPAQASERARQASLPAQA